MDSSLTVPVRQSPQASGDDPVALLDLVYATGTAEFNVGLGQVFGNTDAIHLPCAVWPIVANDNRPGGLLILVSAPISREPARPIDGSTAGKLRDVGEQLLVADRKADAQAELQITLRDQAETALVARDEFMSIAAHELRTPATGIKLSAQLARRVLKDVIPDTPRIDRYLLDIDGGGTRLVALVSDLMDVSRMRSGKLLPGVTPIDLAALVRTVVVRYADTGGIERHHVTLDLPSAPLVVAGDVGRLEQILDNLLSNAIKYSPDGGEIGVRLQHLNEGVVLTVSDTGIGLTLGAQEGIFEPFGRAANAKRAGLPGMGLGLHICRQIAEAHSGRMWAESGGEGQGMTVGMWLPQRKRRRNDKRSV